MTPNYDWKGSPMIDQIVGRCHVHESNRSVVRYAVSRLKKGAWEKLTPVSRLSFLRACIESHRDNRELYHDVMGGNL